MNYPEYKLASIRHLNTCKQLISNIQTTPGQPNENQILLNLYYLAGYTIECIVNYAIYDYIKFNQRADVKTLTTKSNHNVSFYVDKQSKLTPRFAIQTHKFQENCRFFSFKGITDAQKVPYFNGYIPDKSLVPLFNRWKPEVRYVDYGFAKNDIINFCKLSEEIHKKTRLFITKN